MLLLHASRVVMLRLILSLLVGACAASRHVQSLYGKGGYDDALNGSKAMYLRAENKTMPEILSETGNYDAAMERPKNALVVFHLENCPFCQIELGTIEYSYDHHQIFNVTKIQPFHVLVGPEGPVGPGLTFCLDHPDCVAASIKYLGVDVTAIRRFPTTFYYDNEGVGHDTSDTICADMVRSASTISCAYWNSTVIAQCANGENAMSNWICNLKTGAPALPPPPPSTFCAMPKTAWERCAA